MEINKEFLKAQQYKTPDNYETRLSLLTHGMKINFWEWLAKHYEFSSAKNILEVGCGPGHFWEYITSKLNKNQHVTLTDISPGMIAAAEQRLKEIQISCQLDFAVADVEDLKFSNNSFDMVLAHWMLYHANSQQLALSEIKRVLKSSGTAGISTLSLDTSHELLKIANQIDSRISPYTIAAPFSEEKADMLLPQFFNQITKYEYIAHPKFFEVEPILNYFATYPSIQKLNLQEDFFHESTKRIKTIIQQQGFVQTKFHLVHYICKSKK